MISDMNVGSNQYGHIPYTVQQMSPLQSFLHHPCENKQNDKTSQWALNMMKQINTQLHVIQSQLGNQNKNWKTTEDPIHKQNNKITHIEKKLSEFGKIEKSVPFIESTLRTAEHTSTTNKEKNQNYENNIQFLA